MATLFIVATPIGNLKDISPRALETLKGVDLILCEDTREAKKLLDYYKINIPTLSYHQHSEVKRAEEIIRMLEAGKNLALVSDAGTPGISDPGNKLIGLIVGRQGAQIKIVPIPGPSAITAAASISGFPMDRFLFLGFPPAKRKRKKFFKEVLDSQYSVIFYESPHRIIKTLKELDAFNDLAGRRIAVCRELTKKFETIYRGSIAKILKEIEGEGARGEFVVIAEGKK